jgi:hypothetical protein
VAASYDPRSIYKKSPSSLSNPLESVHQGVVSSLRAVAAVVEQRVLVRAPAVAVRDTPDGDTDALLDVEASVGDGDVVVGTSALDVELGDGDLLDVGASKSLESSRDTRSRVPATGTGQVSLSANAINGNTLKSRECQQTVHRQYEMVWMMGGGREG